MISFHEVENIHRLLISEFGGSHGIRDKELLDSALARPFQTFDGKELYSTPIDKAASLIESILINHPFVDGNKRTGYVLMRLLLLGNDIDINATQEDKYAFVISIASGQSEFDDIISWLASHTIKISG
ncbi:MAG: type II toxin-antitoxin system death-on-curing family toxin [Sediminibacterium sp. Gen4]|jgi:death on curing protein|uniref:type II toxin-antitoxin system death-on-curing family toxin n=1 Tax=unclassified Sediminibacterium TaxID=2635961 RepID=UPI0015B849D6|nr:MULTISPECIES: type II toxin-antitoxin system death-on-curing family toxin [unclassified Sediminibacterium]MBW0160078.1 type II toxin-antitoxin system death-on-curing family toxin [Sediminibacterium sp.]MBW0165158.1 type II toxin-antitoxin system death-on-curing family toxin [Sediminibacterium sp.]MDZ4073032.1 type II toxin-antitoxin system death-on-curing family toxin [Sediminibacterium sp.]NWK64612.1 type II toxin-antitoxin system death-on-curing family toxin [Sediminibacterium sp. Gen4]